jgi:nucleotide-binding universal stress UspA family protein
VSPPIVCGVDQSRQARAAARVASQLARRLGLRLELVYVTSRTEAAELSRARRLREQLSHDLDRTDVALRIESGPVSERLREAARHAAALVVGTRGEGALRKALLGSVSANVTRHPPVPVIVVPPGAVDANGDPVATGGVLCGVRDSADVTVAHTAGRIADGLGLELTLVHVIPPPRLPVSAAGGAPPAMLPRRAVDEIADAEQMLTAIAGPLSTTVSGRIRLRVLEGPVGPQLSLIADLDDAALVTLGASERGALAAALAGAPSRHVLHRGSQPVMVCPREPAWIT